MSNSEVVLRKYTALLCEFLEEQLGARLSPNVLFTVKDLLEDFIDEIKQE